MICQNKDCFDDTCKGECKKNPPPVKTRDSNKTTRN